MCWWYYGAPAGGFWWVFPLMGFVVMLLMAFSGVRATRGRGCAGNCRREARGAGAQR